MLKLAVFEAWVAVQSVTYGSKMTKSLKLGISGDAEKHYWPRCDWPTSGPGEEEDFQLETGE